MTIIDLPKIQEAVRKAINGVSFDGKRDDPAFIPSADIFNIAIATLEEVFVFTPDAIPDYLRQFPKLGQFRPRAPSIEGSIGNAVTDLLLEDLRAEITEKVLEHWPTSDLNARNAIDKAWSIARNRAGMPEEEDSEPRAGVAHRDISSVSTSIRLIHDARSILAIQNKTLGETEIAKQHDKVLREICLLYEDIADWLDWNQSIARW